MTAPAGNPNTHASASVFGQWLAEVLRTHAPWAAQIGEETKAVFRERLLEELESHTAEITGPLIDALMSTGKVPDEVGTMLRSISDPQHQVSAIAWQFLVYGVGFAVASQVMAPFLQAVSNQLWADNTYKPIDPAQLVTMAVRGLDPNTTDVTPIPDDIFAIAAESGYSNQYFQAMVDAAGSPPAPQDLFEMFRRGIIDESGLEDGLRQGDTKDSWIANFVKLAYTTPTPIDMVRAAVQNQMSYADANTLAIQLGLEPPGAVADNPDWFQLLFDIAGRPPGPEEVGRMANRGVIPFTGTGASATTFEQAIAESDIKTKWTAALQAIQAHWPSPDEAVSLYRSGSIDAAQLATYLAGSGVTGALATAYTHMATIQEIAQERALAKGNVLTGLYDGIFTAVQATDLLGDIGYVGQVAADLIELTLFRREIHAIDAAVHKVGTLYVGWKMTATDAQGSLQALGIPADQITELLGIWQIERTPEVRLPTISELAKAVQYSGLPFATAVAKAEVLGYTKYDATLIIAAGAEIAPPGGYPPIDDTGEQV